ncbi:MAG: amidohydrolase family protein [Stellaceae bacterium]
MTDRLSPEERALLMPACDVEPSPIPTQVISNGEFMPAPQCELQKKFAARLKERADALAKKRGLPRRAFLRTASGMAAAFLAMNDVYGPIFKVSEAEAADAELGDEHAGQLSDQFVFDVHTHFLKDDTRLQYFVDLRTDTGKRGYNPELEKHRQTFNDVKFPNYVKEMFLDSDTKVAVLSGAPSDLPEDWMLGNDAIRDACDRVNTFAGSRRMLGHFIFVPGQDGWLDAIDHGIEVLKPAGWKGYTIGDNTHKDISRHPWLMDDEQVTYKGYEKFDKAGVRIVAVHKGLFPPSDEQHFPNLTRYAKVDDVAKAAQDWPQLNFLIYHAGYRYTGDGNPALAAKQFEETGRMDWVSDLAEVPAKYGVKNVYADVGASFAAICLSHPRGAAAMMGILIKGLGADHVLWGTDSLWFGSPQWQIEAFRRMEIPDDMQKKQGFAALGPAKGEVKEAILGKNGATVYGVPQQHANAGWRRDGLASMRAAYLDAGRQPSNLAYGYVRKPDLVAGSARS